ncbi:MAG TPA: hypothetical protein VFW98_08270 [Gemmatimonadaceae bacterium]|nr:hypothetical protein [Gemmatimonadaceae bacterium]
MRARTKRTRVSRPVVVAVTSDQHCGSTVALCPERIALDDGGEYVASTAQCWLWANWLDFWGKADALRTAHDAALYTVFNGDLTEGSHHHSTQVLSGNPAAQAAVVNAAMAPVLALRPDRMFFVRGTEAHVGPSACHEERIAVGLTKDGRPVEGDPTSGTASWWHLRMAVHGHRLDFAHHGRMGQRPWTKHTGVGSLAAQIFYEHAAREEAYPQLAIRSHYHRHADSGSLHPTRVVQTPAWQLHTAFVHKVAPDSLADIGGLLILLAPDRPPDVAAILYRADPAPVWRLR